VHLEHRVIFARSVGKKCSMQYYAGNCFLAKDVLHECAYAASEEFAG
jgi:hypothetical protein